MSSNQEKYDFLHELAVEFRKLLKQTKKKVEE